MFGWNVLRSVVLLSFLSGVNLVLFGVFAVRANLLLSALHFFTCFYLMYRTGVLVGDIESR